jgi:hypothetical protein
MRNAFNILLIVAAFLLASSCSNEKKITRPPKNKKDLRVGK